jgi:hypothetical protein
MDRDMHYHGTYALARAAGISRAAAMTIATASEYVDDSDDTTPVTEHPLGARFEHQRTAHHPTDFAPNNDLDDQLRVWVPFHFVPGGEGTGFSERLICRKDSAIVRAMVDHHLGLATSSYGLELIGMTAHVYGDTFAHYGFSGISSVLNRIVSSSLEVFGENPLVASLTTGRLASFFAKYDERGSLIGELGYLVDSAVSAGAEVATDLKGKGALGHGAVATFPDQPFLTWSYAYEPSDLRSGDPNVQRNNIEDFYAGCRALHGMFSRFVAARPDFADSTSSRKFEDIQEMVAAILGTVGDRDARAAEWKRGLFEGQFSGLQGETLPEYGAGQWRQEMASLGQLSSPEAALEISAYRFQQAAAMHRNYMLRDLLPQHNIVLV